MTADMPEFVQRSRSMQPPGERPCAAHDRPSGPARDAAGPAEERGGVPAYVFDIHLQGGRETVFFDA